MGVARRLERVVRRVQGGKRVAPPRMFELHHGELVGDSSGYAGICGQGPRGVECLQALAELAFGGEHEREIDLEFGVR